jgi:hypothetical protein
MGGARETNLRRHPVRSGQTRGRRWPDAQCLKAGRHVACHVTGTVAIERKAYDFRLCGDGAGGRLGAVRKRSTSPRTASRWLVIGPPGEKQERLRAACPASAPRLVAPIQQSFALRMRRPLDPPNSSSMLAADNRVNHCTLPRLWKRRTLAVHLDVRCELDHFRQPETPRSRL